MFGATLIMAILAVAHAIPQVSDSYGQSEKPRLISADESIVCSRASYLAYRKVGTEIGELMLDSSPIPKNAADKQRIIDALAQVTPSGDGTQVFVSYTPTGKVFSTTCAASTCTLEEMEIPMQACLTENWDNCVHSLVRHAGTNYCLLEASN
ncbi:hypothetical protein [Paracoccus methylarcula]|nr:hypothetical protein [Paracoccus methylarcula]